MAAMHVRAFLFPLSLALCSIAVAAPVRAQFYDLDGAYHCLTKADPTCAAETHLPPPAPSPAIPHSGPTMESVIADIRVQRLTPADLQVLADRAENKEPRAVEALAWCKLNGIGVPVDPLEAYFLYGEAAQLGVPHAQANQVAIFENRLTQAQRQEVLMKLQTTK